VLNFLGGVLFQLKKHGHYWNMKDQEILVKNLKQTARLDKK
jgi:hypothetical protein